MTRFRTGLTLGMVLLLTGVLATSAFAQQRSRSGGRGAGMRDTLVGLLGLEQVHQELKLSDEQIAKVKEVVGKLREEMGQQYAGLRDMQDRQQRQAKMDELRDQADAKAREQLRDVIPREQMMRLYQIRLQVRSAVESLVMERIADRLQLTDSQKEKLAAIRQTLQEKTSESYGGLSNLSDAERGERMGQLRETIGKLRSDAEAQALAVLTAEQKAAFEKMKGEKFELPTTN